MRNIKFKNIIINLSVAAAVTFSSCSKIDEFGSMNQNPGSPTKPVTSALLTNVLSGMGSYWWDQGGVNVESGLYCQYFSETQYTEASSIYQKPSANWDGYYAGPLFDLQTIIDYNSDPATAAEAAVNGDNNNQLATARILKAYIFWFLTDTWGDIPYSQALKGEGVIPYDKQQDIYVDLIKEMKEAVDQFNPDGAAFEGDILFNGDINMWRKFANSARAIMALRLSKVDPTLGASEFNAALNATGGVFEEGDAATLSYPGGVFASPVFNYYVNVQRKDYGVSDVLYKAMIPADDRFFAFGTAPVGYYPIGVPFGLPRDQAIAFTNSNPSWSRVVGTSKNLFVDGTDFNAETTPINLLSSSEVYLARAEAAYLKWTDEDYVNNYLLGISENWKQWDVYAGEIVPELGGGSLNGEDYSYYVNETVPLSGDYSADDLKKIATQEWICHYPNGWQGFADWRRTGYPALTPSAGQSTIPRRFPYGPNEYTLNTANATDAAAQYAGNGQDKDSQFGKVWWDK